MRTMAEWLESEETGKEFTHCIRCRFPLLEITSQWLVNKEFSAGECVLEYAICQPCRDSVTDELSEESKEAVRTFLESQIDWAARIQDFMMAHDPAARFEACISCQTSRSEIAGFSLSALFDGDGSLIAGALPLLICQPCIHRATANLSDASRAVWRKFLLEHFDGPPDDFSIQGLF